MRARWRGGSESRAVRRRTISPVGDCPGVMPPLSWTGRPWTAGLDGWDASHDWCPRGDTPHTHTPLDRSADAMNAMHEFPGPHDRSLLAEWIDAQEVTDHGWRADDRC